MRLFALLLAAGLTSLAHPQPASLAPEPQVNPDHTVTFRYAAPAAYTVDVSVESTRTLLHKDAAGLWTGTTAALPPELYTYHFDVDGRNLLDPANFALVSSYTAAGNSFLVPGHPAAPWETAAVPHGTVHRHTYTSKVVLGLDGNQSEFYVYTPPGYDPRAGTPYPVLYLLHGWSHTAGDWSSIGRENEILDSLIAEGKARPMIVVMPTGYGAMSFVRSGFNVWRDEPTIEQNTALFTKALLTEVLPQVEKLYNASPRREDRAIAGLSMGGLESLMVGLNHSEQFAWVGGFSAAVHMVHPQAFAELDPRKANLKLLWIACGTSDELLEPNRDLAAALKADGFPVTEVETPGIHNWLVWRDNLVHFAPLLFQSR